MRFVLNIVLLPFLPFAMLLGATEALVRRLGPLGVVVRILSLPLWLLALPVALDATDVRAQADVCTALEKLGHAAARRQDPVATAYFAEAHAVLSKVDELSPLSEPDQAWRTELARLAQLS